MMLTLAGAKFGPIHNIVGLCLADWQPAEVVASNTRLPIETVWFVLSDLQKANMLESRPVNGTEFRVSLPPSHSMYDCRGRALSALELRRRTTFGNDAAQ